MTPPPITRNSEGGGLVLLCACRWTRFAAGVNEAAEFEREHVKKCKTARGEGDE